MKSHDELVGEVLAALAKDPSNRTQTERELQVYTGCSGSHKQYRVGYADVITCEEYLTDFYECACGSEVGKAEKCLNCALCRKQLLAPNAKRIADWRNHTVIEVKSNREDWTAGGVVRQLKGYAAALPSGTEMALYCDRALTAAESAILANAGITVVRSPF